MMELFKKMDALISQHKSPPLSPELRLEPVTA
jgi:hypothetical protein